MQIGARVYYDKATGDPIFYTGEMSDGIAEPTTEQDFENYVSLSQRVPETVGAIRLAYKEKSQDFTACNSWRVDVTGEPTLKFSYPDPNTPEAPPVYRQPLSEEVATLKERDTLMQADITAIIELLGG